jgi:hypothetical protein
MRLGLISLFVKEAPLDGQGNLRFLSMLDKYLKSSSASDKFRKGK